MRTFTLERYQTSRDMERVFSATLRMKFFMVNSWMIYLMEKADITTKMVIYVLVVGPGAILMAWSKYITAIRTQNTNA